MVLLRASLTLCLALAAFGGEVQLLPSLPSGVSPMALQLDSSGNIYVAGSMTPQNPKSSSDTSDAFVAKVSPDGSSVIYFRAIAGSGRDLANALWIGADGSAYVVGTTSSADLPATPGALQTTLGATQGSRSQAFAAKLDPTGAIHYLTYLGGAAVTSGDALAVDAAGEVYVTGGASSNGFPVTPGAVTGASLGYVMKLDATGSTLLLAAIGFGGSLIALDSHGNIYVAGDDIELPGSTATLATPGAFQTKVAFNICSSTLEIADQCGYQFVQKADPTGTKLIYATYVAGSFGATPAAMTVDGSGNVILAGTTNSADYPVTSGAFQAEYLANALPPPQLVVPMYASYPPPSTGFVTKLNSTGSGLVWSTFFGGSVYDAISSMRVDADGNVYVAGQANSPDLPGLSATPANCRPSLNQGLGFVGRLSADGATAALTQIIYGAPSCTYGTCYEGVTSSGAWLLAPLVAGTAVVVGQNGVIATVNLLAPGPLACLVDFADNVQLRSVAPGQILSLFGTPFGIEVLPIQSPQPPPPSYNGFTVTFNGVAAPLLYTSGEQINLQVPYEVAGQSSVLLQIMIGASLVDSRTLTVVPQQPSVALSPAAFNTSIPNVSSCGTTFNAPQALALNSDGTVNTCSNPAVHGSVITLIINGLGVTSPAQTTGSISPPQPVGLLPAVTGTGVISTTTLPGVIDGVAGVRVQVQQVGPVYLGLEVNGLPVRQPDVVVWTK